MPSRKFQRARQPEQKQQRRLALLEAAGRLMDDGGIDAVTLSAIARTAGLAKSNVYRYFESREEILLHLLIDDEMAWLSELEHALAPLAGSNDAENVADAVARTITARPRTCALIAVVANVLEHNVSESSVHYFKRRTLELSHRITNALHAALPGLPHDHTPALLRYLHALVAGLWPMANPCPVAAGVMETPDYAPFVCDFQTDLRGGLLAMLRGIVAS